MAGQREGAMYSVSIHVARRRDLEVKLDKAIDAAIEEASGHPGLGILVSRHDRQTLTVELTGEVPYRTIVERDLRTHRP